MTDAISRVNNLSNAKHKLLALRLKRFLANNKPEERTQKHVPEAQVVSDQRSTKTEGAKRRLTAYLVRNQGVEATAQVLRTFLQERLPYYMIPNNFLFSRFNSFNPKRQSRPAGTHPFCWPGQPG